MISKKQKITRHTAVFDNNIIFSDDVKMSLNTRQHGNNLNVLIIGGSGTGKTRYYLLPNLLNGNTSFCITDPKGEILKATGTFLKRAGYDVRVFNIIDMANSNNYNPFAYVYKDNRVDETKVKRMIKTLISNVCGEGAEKDNKFFYDMAENLITAFVYYLLEEGAKSEQNFATVAELMLKVSVSEGKDKNAKTEADLIFEEMEKKRPNSLAVKSYRAFKQGGSGKTSQSILSTAQQALEMFKIPAVRDLTCIDKISLDTIGDKKTALFIIIPAMDKTFSPLVAMMYTQMFFALYDKAQQLPGERLPVHVRFLLDEFANIGKIPQFEEITAFVRSMEMSLNVIIQATSQLKTMYEKSWETIVGNCGTTVFLGSPEMTTLEDISKRLGKETVDVEGQNRTKGRQSSTSEQNSILGVELKTPDQLAKLDNALSIVLVRGKNPFLSKKYNLFRHPNYKFSALYDKENSFDYGDIKIVKMPVFEFEKERLANYEKLKKIKVSNSKKQPEKPKTEFENRDLTPLEISPFTADYNKKYGLDSALGLNQNDIGKGGDDKNDKGETSSENAVIQQEFVADINLDGIL